MRIIVTGASGPFGRGVTRHLVGRGVAPSDLILSTRKPQQLADLARQRAGELRTMAANAASH